MTEPMTREAAEEFLGVVFRGVHHIPGELKPFGRGWKVNAWGGIATFDWDVLTRLVLHAHDACVRVEIIQGAPRRVGVAIFQRRSRTGGVCVRHPTIEQALEDWRKAGHRPVAQETETND